jgi:Uma2 family endonuclease
MNPAIRTDMTPAQYLEFERASDVKHEYYPGDRYTMTGTFEERRTIAANIVCTLKSDLKDSPYRVRVLAGPSTEDLEIAVVSALGSPDPIVVFEILHPTYPHKPRKWRFLDYERVASLREYAWVDTDYLAVRHHVRFRDDPKSWHVNFLGKPDDSLALDSIDVRIPGAAIYAGIEFRDESAIAYVREMAH